jgi:hypothetical protein
LKRSLLFLGSLILVLMVANGAYAASTYTFAGTIAEINDAANAAAIAGVNVGDSLDYTFLLDFERDGETLYYEDSPAYWNAGTDGYWLKTHAQSSGYFYIALLSGDMLIQEVNGGRYDDSDGNVAAWNWGINQSDPDSASYFQVGDQDQYMVLQKHGMDVSEWIEGTTLEFRTFTYDDAGNATFLYDGDIVLTEINAVPVPAAIWLLGSGLLGLAGMRKRILK